MLGFLPMPHKVIIEASTGLDDWGVAVAGQSQTVNARVSYNTRKEAISLASGESVIFTARILLEGLPEVSYESFVTFTDERGNSFTKQPLEVDYKFDLSGSPVAVSVTV
jgi:hypothetical protein